MKKKPKPGAENRPPGYTMRLTSKTDLNPNVVRTANEIRQVYIRERSAYESMVNGREIHWTVPKLYDGKPDLKIEDADEGEGVVEKGSQNTWLDLARKFLAKKIDPEPYIRESFDKMVLGKPPEPRQLLSEAAIEHWEKMKDKLEGEVETALTIQTRLAYSGITYLRPAHTENQAYTLVLRDEDLDLSPLFRYCLAVRLGRKEPEFLTIAAGCRMGAVLQFMRYEEAYLKHWSAWLPRGFQAKARRWYASFTEERPNDPEEA